ncbi:DHH family phosphoesterase, partial [Nitratifractor sp.]
AETFTLARSLIERGADPATIAQMMIQRRSLASLRILGKALESLRLYADAQVAIMRISREDLAATGATASDLDGVVDYARSLVTVEVAALVVEMKSETKVSLRSKGVDLLPVAEAFGGGGHREAAGFELPGHVSDRVIEDLLQCIENEGVLTKQ